MVERVRIGLIEGVDLSKLLLSPSRGSEAVHGLDLIMNEVLPRCLRSERSQEVRLSAQQQ